MQNWSTLALTVVLSLLVGLNNSSLKAQQIVVNEINGAIFSCSTAPSEQQEIKETLVSANELLHPLEILAPVGFEISTNPESGFTTSITLIPTIGSIEQPVFVRLAQGLSSGSITGNISFSSNGASTRLISVTGVTQSMINITPVENLIVAHGEVMPEIKFSTGIEGPTFFNWTNSTPSIGLTNNGKGSLPSFTPTNNSNSPIEATIQVTATSIRTLAYIPTGNQIEVIDYHTQETVDAIPLGDEFFNSSILGIAINPNGKRVYATNPNYDVVHVINTQGNYVLENIPVGDSPEGIVISPDGMRVYVVNSSSNNVSVIDTETNSVIGIIQTNNFPKAITINNTGTRLFLTMESGVEILSTASMSSITTISIAGFLPMFHSIAISPDNNYLYVVDGSLFNNTVSIVNTLTNSIVKVIPVGSLPYGIAISHDGKYAYVTNSGDNTISVINTDSFLIEENIPVMASPKGISISEDGTVIGIVSYQSEVMFLDTENYANSGIVSLGTVSEAIGHFMVRGNGCPAATTNFTITVMPPLANPPVINITEVNPIIKGCEGVNTAGTPFTITGFDLVSDITLQCSEGFELSLAKFGVYTSSLVLSPVNSQLDPTILYIRNTSDLPIGKHIGTIKVNAVDYLTRTISLQSTVSPIPELESIDDLVVTNGYKVPQLNPVTNGLIYWENDNAEIGLSQNGVISIPEFTSSNLGSDPSLATFNVRSVSIENFYTLDYEYLSIANDSLHDRIYANGANYSCMVVDDHRNRIYTGISNGKIAVINKTTHEIEKYLGVSAVSLTLSKDNRYLYAVNQFGGYVDIVDLETNSISSIKVTDAWRAGYGRYCLALSPDGTTAFITNQAEQVISVFNTQTRQLIYKIPVKKYPDKIVISPNGQLLYIIQQESISAYNARSFEWISDINIQYSSNLSFNENGTVLYVAALNNLISIDTQNNIKINEVILRAMPLSMDIDYQGRIWLATDPAILVYDGRDLKKVKQFDINAFVVIAPTAPGTGCTSNSEQFTITVLPDSINVSPLSGRLSACPNTHADPLGTQQFDIIGKNLSEQVTLSAPSTFEISESKDQGFTQKLVLTPDNKSIMSTIYVRIAEGAIEGSVEGSLILQYPKAKDLEVKLSGIVHEKPKVIVPENIAFVHGDTVAPIPFVSTNGTAGYDWTSSTTIGLDTFGQGTIPSFVATNTSAAPISSTISVTPTSTSKAYVVTGNWEKQQVIVYNGHTEKVTQGPTVGTLNRQLLENKSLNQIYILESNEILVIDSNTDTLLATIRIPQPITMTVSPDGQFLYVSTYNKGTFIVNAVTHAIVKNSANCYGTSFALSPDGKLLYTVWREMPYLNVYNAQTLELISFRPITKNNVLSNHISIGISPDGNYIYGLINYSFNPGSESEIAVFDTGVLQVERRIPLNEYVTNWVGRTIQISQDGNFAYFLYNSQFVVYHLPSGTQASKLENYAIDSFSVVDDRLLFFPASGSLLTMDIKSFSILDSTNLGIKPNNSIYSYFATHSTGCVGDPAHFTITVYPEGHPLPVIQTSKISGQVFSCQGVSQTRNQANFKVSGRNLIGPVEVTGSQLEFSSSPTGVFTPNLSLIPTGGSIIDHTIYVRSIPSASLGSYSNLITIKSAGANTKQFNVPSFVSEQPALIPNKLPEARVDQYYSTQISGFRSEFSYTTAGLPEGLSINSLGLIAGTPLHATLTSTDVILTVNNNGCSQTVTYQLKVQKGFAQLQLANSVVNYDGTEQKAIVQTTPLDLPVVVTYNGESTAPIDAGQYSISARVNSDDYEGELLTSFIIQKGVAYIQLENLVQVYDGAVKNITVTTIPENLSYSILYNSQTSATNAGLYWVSVIIDDLNYVGYSEGFLTVHRAPQEITFPSIENKQIDMDPFEILATASSGLPVNLEIISGPASINNNWATLNDIGVVRIRATQSGNNNYLPAKEVESSFIVTAVTDAENSIENKLILTPNPTLGDLKVFTPESGSTFGIKITDSKGMEVFTMKNVSTETKIDISMLSPGLYLACITISGSELVVFKRLIKY